MGVFQPIARKQAAIMLVFHWTYHRAGSSDSGRSQFQKPIVDNTLKKGASHHGTSRDFLNHCLRNCAHRSSEQDNKGRMVVNTMKNALLIKLANAMLILSDWLRVATIKVSGHISAYTFDGDRYRQPDTESE